MTAAQPALATQTHGAPEGLYMHQFSHLFFILAMGILIYWLRSRDLVQQKGWRMIQYAAVFFILWSADAFLVHLIDEQAKWIALERVSRWEMHMQPAGGHAWLSWFYYLLKLDHVFCLPGMIFLYAGLRNLSHTAGAEAASRDGGL
ncbi:MAG: hypothetical protein KGY56_13250 [Desulfobacterales bacterium]|nr:hypothetical protein [Desulfobacterales bacterium]